MGGILLFRIAICDDNPVFLDEFKKQISVICAEKSINYDIDSFSTITEFIGELNNGVSFHLLFLDIKFAHTTKTGIDVADYIRTHLSEHNIHIVFISSQPKYAMQLFDFQPLHFLIKPIDFNKLKKTIEKSLEFWDTNQQILHFMCERKEMAIEIQQIICIEAFGRKKIIRCVSGKTYTTNDSFKNLLRQLEQYDFFVPHKSYIVNYHKVRLWHKDKIIMINDDVIPISRPKIKEVQAYLITRST